jgi:DUF4097 and DUF4098 domain-containing protein YvlB
VPAFETPQPIFVTIDIGAGDVRLVAGDRTDTVVEVRPTDPGKRDDVTAAQQTRVEYAPGRLQIRGRRLKRYSWRSDGGSVEVSIELPAGSRLSGDAAMAGLRGTGPLGESRFKTGAGTIDLEHAGGIQLQTGIGDITVGHASGAAEVSTGSGAVRIGAIDGTAVIKNSNGDTRIGDVSGDVRVHAANGRIDVEQAHAAVSAKTANGDIRLADVRRGSVTAETALGKIEVGIGSGVAAWLDLHTHFGNVDNRLDAVDEAEPGEATVEVRARTSAGDITIRRSITQPVSSEGTA